MAKGFDPSMPFYVNDYLSSPRVRLLTLELRGAFVELLCYCWSSQSASITDDDDALATLSGLGREKWHSYGSRALRPLFCAHPEMAGCLTNEKVFKVWSERVAFRKAKSIAGSAGNKKRWSRSHSDTFANRKSVADSDTSAIVLRVAKHRSSSSTLVEEADSASEEVPFD